MPSLRSSSLLGPKLQTKRQTWRGAIITSKDLVLHKNFIQRKKKCIFWYDIHRTLPLSPLTTTGDQR